MSDPTFAVFDVLINFLDMLVGTRHFLVCVSLDL